MRSNGLIAIHHNPDTSSHKDPPPVADHVDVVTSMNYFSVHWQRSETNNEMYPSVSNNCGHGACEVYDELTCLCDTTVVQKKAFSKLPSRQDALSALSIGAFPLSMFDEDVYELVEKGDGIEAWNAANEII